MSDKETAPHFQVPPDHATREELIGALQYWVIRAKTAERVAVECTAPAPQPDAEKIRLLLIRAVMEMSYMHCAEVLSLVRSSEGESIIEEGMKLLGLKDLSEEELARVRAATPQVTPTQLENAYMQCAAERDMWKAQYETLAQKFVRRR